MRENQEFLGRRNAERIVAEPRRQGADRARRRLDRNNPPTALAGLRVVVAVRARHPRNRLLALADDSSRLRVGHAIARRRLARAERLGVGSDGVATVGTQAEAADSQAVVEVVEGQQAFSRHSIGGQVGVGRNFHANRVAAGFFRQKFDDKFVRSGLQLRVATADFASIEVKMVVFQPFHTDFRLGEGRILHLEAQKMERRRSRMGENRVLDDFRRLHKVEFQRRFKQTLGLELLRIERNAVEHQRSAHLVRSGVAESLNFDVLRHRRGGNQCQNDGKK